MTVVPEAVEEIWFEQPPVNELREERAVRRLGSFGGRRSGIQNVVEQTMARIHRFREDIEWRVFDEPPRPEDLAGVDVWIDPTTAISDFDGFVAEATVGGKPVIASRTPVNSIRLEQGRTGWLVPPADPNELTHAILGALFKPEVARLKMNAAAQTAGKFRPRQRLRVLERIYQTLIP